jgi:hypothetical protein
LSSDGKICLLCARRTAMSGCMAVAVFSRSEIKKCNHVPKKNLEMSGAMHYTLYLVTFLKKLYYLHQGMEGVMEKLLCNFACLYITDHIHNCFELFFKLIIPPFLKSFSTLSRFRCI